MASQERRERILAELRQYHALSVNDITSRFGCSLSTARRDLDALAALGRIHRTHGGGVAVNGPDTALRSGWSGIQPDLLAVEKRRIARAAAELVAEGDTVGLGGGTTTLEVTRALHGRRVTIVTNALDLVMDLVPVPGARVVMLAGELMASARELIGPLVEETLAHVNMDTLFLSVNGLSAERGVGIMSHLEAGVYAAMADRARRLVVVADHSKIGRPALAHALPITGVHVLVTDAAGPSAALTAIKDAGVRVIEV